MSKRLFSLVLTGMIAVGIMSFSAGAQESVSTDYRDYQAQGLQASGLGQLTRAEKAFRRALELRRAEVPETDLTVVDIRLYLAQNLSQQAKFRESAVLFESVRLSMLELSDPSLNARYYVFLAIDQINRGSLDEAAQNARAATRLLTRALKEQKQTTGKLVQGVGVSILELAHALAVESSISLRLGNLPLARQNEALARKIVVDTPDTPKWWLSQLDDLRAKIEIEDGKIDEAEKRLRTSLVFKRQAYGETRPAAEVFIELGDLLHSQNKSEEAVQSLKRGMEIVEEGLKEGQALTPERVGLYLRAAKSLADSNTDQRDATYAEMFAASQLARQGTTARTLDRVIARLSAGNAEVAAQIRKSQETAQKRDEARLALGTEAAKKRDERDPARLEALQALYNSLVTQAEQEAAKLREVFPEYEQVVESQTVEVANLQEALQPREAFVSFSIGRDRGYTFFVTRDRLQVHEFDAGQDQIDWYVTRLKSAFDVTDGSLSEYDIGAANELYKLLFGSLDRDIDNIDHMVVAPNGSLLSLPFGILARNKPNMAPGKQAYLATRWLARDVASSIAPSIKSFVGLRQLVQPSRAAKALMGFGDPIFEGQEAFTRAAAAGHMDEEECDAEGILPSHAVRGLAPLPDTRDELKIVANLVGDAEADFLFGDEVTEPAVTAKDLSDYRVIYFATHGLLPQEIECQSEPALALTAPLQTVDKQNDGLLSASEITDLNLDAELVVLSACNTGGGDGQFGGDSLSGLARSFFFAGARSLLVSHWQVSSRDTVSLMTGLFGQSAIGLSEAMRLAQLDMMQDAETAHPFFWGPFTLVGDGSKKLVF